MMFMSLIYYNLLCICAKQDYFKFNSKMYLQTSGLSMGSPLSPFLAEVFISWLERTLISTNTLFNHIVYWYRYVDDIICLFKGNNSDFDDFLNFLNSLHNNIKFTFESSHNNKIPFLDLNISIINSEHHFEIYRKPTCTDTIIPFDSLHHHSHKFASLRCFIHRLLNTPLSNESFESELKIIKQIAYNNGFPMSLFESFYKKTVFKYNIRNNFTLTPISDSPTYHTITFFGDISRNVAKIFQKSKININFRSSLTLNSLLVKTKDPIEPFDRSGIYKLNCECGQIYIGRTIRSFKIRFQEHIRQLTKLPDDITSNFAKHIIEKNHNFSPVDCLKPIWLLEGRKTVEFFEILEIKKQQFQNKQKLLNEQQEFDNIFLIPLILRNFK